MKDEDTGRSGARLEGAIASGAWQAATVYSGDWLFPE